MKLLILHACWSKTSVRIGGRGNPQPRPQCSSVGIAWVKLPDWIGIEVKLMYDVVVPPGSVRRNTRVASVRAAWGDLVKLFKKNKSKYYWYDFTVRGERYRGSTKETNRTRAQKAAALKLAAAIKGSDRQWSQARQGYPANLFSTVRATTSAASS